MMKSEETFENLMHEHSSTKAVLRYLKESCGSEELAYRINPNYYELKIRVKVVEFKLLQMVPKNLLNQLTQIK